MADDTDNASHTSNSTNDGPTSDESSTEETWIQRFINERRAKPFYVSADFIRGNEMLCEVDVEYIEDEFNLYGLDDIVPNYEYALEMILDTEPEYELTDEENDVVQENAELLYGLIHARFITTSRGISLMAQKYVAGDFGICPRVLCEDQAVLPVGMSDRPDVSTVKLFCPCCEDVFNLPSKRRATAIDGAFFGTSFPHLFILQYPDLKPIVKPPPRYVPRIFGFKVCKEGGKASHAQSTQRGLRKNDDDNKSSAGQQSTSASQINVKNVVSKQAGN